MLALGTQAPSFSLPSVVDGGTVSLADLEGRPLLVTFISRHCPYVKHLQVKLAKVGNAYQAKGVAVVAIGSNDPLSYPADAPERLAEQAHELGFEFPYLFDGTQGVARAYKAACTPDFFLFDANHQLAYRGQFDGSRPRSDAPVTGADLMAALDAVLAGEPVADEQKPSMGCSIKWREAVNQ